MNLPTEKLKKILCYKIENVLDWEILNESVFESVILELGYTSIIDMKIQSLRNN